MLKKIQKKKTPEKNQEDLKNKVGKLMKKEELTEDVKKDDEKIVQKQNHEGKISKQAIWILGTCTILFFSLFISFLMFNRKSGNGVSLFGQKPTTTPVLTKAKKLNTPTPTRVVIDHEKFKIIVLNGNGIPGDASLAKKILEEAEFQNIQTGNAARIDFQETLIEADQDFVQKEFLEKLISTLSDVYVVSSSMSAAKNLTPEDTVVVTLGKKK